MTRLVLQINSVPALEKLLGDDPDNTISLSIRQNVAEEFAKKHIKCLMDGVVYDNVNQIRKDLTNELKKEVESVVKDLVGDIEEKKYTYSWEKYWSINLNEAIKTTIKNQTENYIASFVEKAIKEAEANWPQDRIDRMVKTWLTPVIENRIKKTIIEKLNELDIGIKI